MKDAETIARFIAPWIETDLPDEHLSPESDVTWEDKL